MVVVVVVVYQTKKTRKALTQEDAVGYYDDLCYITIFLLQIEIYLRNKTDENRFIEVTGRVFIVLSEGSIFP